MNKHFKRFFVLLLIFSMSTFTLQGCYGNFNLTKKLYKWNGSLGDKYINSIVMWVLVIVPVYGLAGFADFAIFNLIEFWTGKNPVTMAPGEQEIKVVEMNGKKYEITASANRFDIREIGTTGFEKEVSLVYNTDDQTWYAETEQGVTRLAQLDPDNSNILQLIEPDGSKQNFDLRTNQVVKQ